MGKPGIYVTRMLPSPVMELLKEHCDMEVNPYDRVLEREELYELGRTAKKFIENVRIRTRENGEEIVSDFR